MPALKNPSEEQFCLNMLTMKQGKAYEEAFPVAKNWKYGNVAVRAYRLAKLPRIQERIQELKQQAADKVISVVASNRIERMDFLSAVMRDENASMKSRLQAVDLLNKMEGDYVQKVEATVAAPVAETVVQIAAILDGAADE